MNGGGGRSGGVDLLRVKKGGGGAGRLGVRMVRRFETSDEGGRRTPEVFPLFVIELGNREGTGGTLLHE
jgi:hypothetical protein